ncbi:Appr-1-p processing domain protein [Parafrankia sp. EAN1pec]|uniref:macro domain-containing protein n=1 Tax=Parafrankia TaxID=2994362 RepID=UPI00015DA05E|nr:Appr-1-p processing domain protein [Frankia sp. EAN1pec]
MSLSVNTKKCFVVMPFGEKAGPDGSLIDFDNVYRDVIREPVESLGFKVVRADEIERPGSIHSDMFRHIAMDDLAIVDITTGNPNVLYELGVRHALRPSLTIIIKRRGTKIPFNFAGERVIDYPSVRGSYADSREEIRRYIENGLKKSETDSPIFNFLQDARKDWKRERITSRDEYRYRTVSSPKKKISVITGDIRDWRGIDVWVNSENTNMQMARFFDRSLSAMIRYEGAVKDASDEVVEDTIAGELTALLGGRETVTAGAVYVTGSGALAATRGVKKIFHAASTQGVPGSGYQMIQNVERCVTASMRRIDEQFADAGLRSIVFPMMGTGEGGGDVYATAPRLIQTAVAYLAFNPDSVVEKVYFSAWNRRDLEACLNALTDAVEVEPIG